MPGAGSINSANAFPLPIGVTVSFGSGGPNPQQYPHWSMIAGLLYTKNFQLLDAGLWTITINVDDLGNYNDQIILNTTTGLVGKHGGGTNTALITMAQSGYYSLFNPVGGQTYNFSTVNTIKMAALTFASGGVLGP